MALRRNPRYFDGDGPPSPATSISTGDHAPSRVLYMTQRPSGETIRWK
jgi:hypothetical protein